MSQTVRSLVSAITSFRRVKYLCGGIPFGEKGIPLGKARLRTVAITGRFASQNGRTAKRSVETSYHFNQRGVTEKPNE